MSIRRKKSLPLTVDGKHTKRRHGAACLFLGRGNNMGNAKSKG